MLTPSWSSELALRLKRLFWLKLIGTTAFTWLFFIAYFQLLRNPVNAVSTMPLTPVDAWVSFQPWALIPYLSLWLYVGVAPGLQRNFANLFVYGSWCLALSLTGLLIFYLWPTQIPTFLHVSDAPGMTRTPNCTSWMSNNSGSTCSACCRSGNHRMRRDRYAAP